MKGLVIGRYTGVFDLKAKVSINGKLIGHMTREFEMSWYPRYGPVKGKLLRWTFHPLDGSKALDFYQYNGTDYRDKKLMELYGV